MATLSQFPPALQVTNADDDMEISSQLGHHDNDIDIDLDVHSEAAAEQDNDVQLDDARSEAGSMMHTQDEDMVQDYDNAMYEGQEGGEDAIIDVMAGDQRHTYQDFAQPNPEDVADPYDVALDDATDEQHYDATHGTSDHLQFDNIHDQVPEDQVEAKDVENFDLEGDTESFTDAQEVNLPPLSQSDEGVPIEAPAPGEDPTKPHNPEETVEPNMTAESLAPLPESETNGGVDEAENIDTHGADQESAPHSQRFGHTNDETAQGEGDGGAVVQEHEQAAPHPIMVSYHNNRFSLFPPTNEEESDEYLLQDSSLVYRSLTELLGACREVLSQDVGDELELRLVFSDLGLQIGEESPHAFSTSLSEILEAFLDLHKLDGVENPEALEVVLEKRERFTAGLSRLRASIADGRGMSKLWDAWNDDTETQVEYDAAHDDADTGDGGPLEEAEGVHLPEADRQYQAQDNSNTAEPIPEGVVEEDETDNLAEGAKHQAVHGESDYQQNEVQVAEKGTQEASIGADSSGVQLVDDKETHEQTDTGDLNSDTAPEEEDIIDYSEDEPEEDVKSSDSSTVVGDATTAANAEGLIESTTQQHGAGGMPEYEEPTEEKYGVLRGDEAELTGPETHFAEEFGNIFEEADSNTLSEVQHQGTHTAAVSTAGEDEVDNVDWAHADQPGQPSREQVVGHSADGSPTADNDGWDELIEPSAVEDTTTVWGTQGAEFDDNLDLGISSEALAAAEDEQRGEDGSTVAAAALDDQDEITFDDDEDGQGLDGDTGHEEQPSIDKLPDQSPLGKRSYMEHLHGDSYGDGNDLGTVHKKTAHTDHADGYPEAKRLRST